MYENKRVNGRVVTAYLGPAKNFSEKNEVHPDSKNNFVRNFAIVLGIVFLIIVGLFLYNNNFSPTGNAVLNIESNYVDGQNLEGKINLVLKQGELIPLDSDFEISLSNTSKNYKLSELTDVEKVTGDYYVEGKNIIGNGEGYGIIGEKIVYPEIDFEIKLIKKSESDNSPSDSPSSDDSSSDNPSSEVVSDTPALDNPSSENPSSDNPSSEVVSDTPASDNPSQDNNPSSDEPSSNEPSSNEPSTSAISGNAIREFDSQEVISGSVRKGEDFKYIGEFSDYEIVSLEIEGEEVSNSLIQVDLNDEGLIVSSDYEIVQTGFGEEFLGEEELKLDIDVSNLEVLAKDGNLEVSLSYMGEEIISASQEIVVSDSNNDSNPESGSESGGEVINPIENSSNQNITDSNFSDLNVSENNITEINITNVSEVESNNISYIELIKEFDTLRLLYNSTLEINLSNHFLGAESYEFSGTGLNIEFFENNAILSAEEGFKGAVKARFLAINGSEKLEGNEFIILVSSGAINIVTSREKIVVGEDVKWTKSVNVDNAESIILDLPGSAENISITKLDDLGNEEEIEFESVLSGNVVRGSEKGGNFIFELFNKIISAITGRVITDNLENETIQVELNQNATNYLIEYTTPAPKAVEEEKLRGKNVIITGPELGYTNVIAQTNISEIYGYNRLDSIKIYWRNYDSNLTNEIKEVKEVAEEEVVEEIITDSNLSEEIIDTSTLSTGLLTGNVVLDSINSSNYVLEEIPFDAYDTDFDGLIDYIEWVVPHLSEQTFEIIFITKAEELDSDRLFLRDIYDLVSVKDENFVSIEPGNYVRVTFEKNLTSEKDITLYARSNGGEVEVYEKDGNDILMTFDINEYGEYKQYLSNLEGEQDTFDLLVKNTEVEFDYIVDPTVIYVNDSIPRFSGNPANEVNITSSSFTPPANSLLVTCVSADTGDNDVVYAGVASSNGLTWTNRVEMNYDENGLYSGYAAIFTAPVTTSVSMNVSVFKYYGNGGTNRVSAKVYIVSGVDLTNPVGSSNGSGSTTNNINGSYVSSSSNSIGFGCANDWESSGAPSSLDVNDSAHYSGESSVISIYKQNATNSSGSIVELNFDAGGTDPAEWTWVTLEIVGDTPKLSFVSPTPPNGASRNSTSVYVNLSSNGPFDHYSFVDFDNSLYAWYKFEEGNGTFFADKTGKRNGTCSGAACPTFNSSGKWNGSYQFDPAADYITLSPEADFRFFNRSFAISMWTFALAKSPNDFYGLIGKETDFVLYSVSNSYWTFWTWRGSWQAINAPAGSFHANKWQHIVIMNNGTYGWMYINGTLAASGSQIYSVSTSNSVTINGKSASRFSNGTIDEVIIFNRTLTSAEILSLYNSSANKYSNNFTGLANGLHQYTGYSVNRDGEETSTETRTITLDTSFSDSSGCLNITSSGTYSLLNDVINHGATCFNITASNVLLDGNGYTLDGDGSSDSIGFYVSNVENVTIKNFMNVTGFYSASEIYNVKNITIRNVNYTYNSYGLDILYVNNSLFSDFIIYNTSSGSGFDITNSSHNLIYNVSSNRNRWQGIDFDNSKYNILNNIETNDNLGEGIEFGVSSNNRINGFNTYRNNYGFDLTSYSTNVTLINVSAIDNAYVGFNFYQAFESNIYNSTSYSSQHGIIISESEDINFTSIHSYDNEYEDIYQNWGVANNIYLIDSIIPAYILIDPSIYMFKNSTYGEIKFISGINGTGTNLIGNLTSDIRFANNSAFVNSSKSGLNKSANITFYGIYNNFVNPKLIKDEDVCSNCYNFTSLNAGTVKFNVTSFSTYSVQDFPDIYITNCQTLSIPRATYHLQNNINDYVGTCFSFSANNITIDGNGYYIDGTDGSSDIGIYAENRSNITIRSFKNISQFYEGIYLLNVSESRIHNVSLIDNDNHGLNILNSRNNRIYDIISYLNYQGIVFSQVSNSSLINISYNDDDISLYLYLSNNNSIANASFGSAQYGLRLDDSDYNNFTNINLSSSVTVDLYQQDSASDNNYIIDSVIGSYNIATASKFMFRNSTYGEIRFLSGITGTGEDLFGGSTSYIRFYNNTAYLDSNQAGLNKAANVTLYGIGERGYTVSAILKDGVPCSSSVCKNFTALNATNVIFNVTSWSNYSIGNNSYLLYGCGVLSNAGNYTLQNSINNRAGNCFNLTTSNIIIDGAGYSIDGDDSGTDYGIYSLGVDNITIKNFKNITDFFHGIYIINSSGDNIYNNSFVSNQYHGFNLYNVSYSNISKINSSYNARYGYIERSNHNIFDDLWGTDNPTTGFQINTNSINSTINNFFSRNGASGLFLATGCNYNRISNVLLINHSYAGLHLYGGVTYSTFQNVTIINGTGRGLFYTNNPSPNDYNNFTNFSSYSNNMDLFSEAYGFDDNNFMDSRIGSYNITDSEGYLPNRIRFVNSTYGEIKFLVGINGSGTNLIGNATSNIRFANNSAFVNSTYMGLNKSANITFYGISTSHHFPTILRDGVECTSGCYNFTSLNAGTVVFNVSSWSNYSIGEDYTISSCGTLNVTNANYTLLVNISNYAGNCFTITADNITLNGNNNIIDGDDSGSDYGVFSAGYNGLKIYNLNVGDFWIGLGISNGRNHIYRNISSYSNTLRGFYTDTLNLNYSLENISAYSNSQVGFVLHYLFNGTLNNIRSYSNSQDGFTISSYSRGNNFSNFNVSNNGWEGITIANSHYNNFTNILVGSNGFRGITFLSNASNNNFINLSINSNNGGIAFQGAVANLNNVIENMSISGNQPWGFISQVTSLIDGTTFINSKVTSYSFANFSKLTFRNSTYGEIKFLEGINGSGTNLFNGTNSEIYFGNNSAYVNGSKSSLNKSANVTLYGLSTNYSNPKIHREGSLCTNCYNFTSLNAGNVVFNVSSWSNYSIGEDYNINLTNCGVLSARGVTYTLLNDVAGHSGSHCFEITADNITLNGNGKSISATGGEYIWGITASGNNLTIYNLSISNFGNIDCAESPGGGGINLNNVHNSTIYSINHSDGCYGLVASASNGNKIDNSSFSLAKFGVSLSLSEYNNLTNVEIAENVEPGLELSSANNNIFNKVRVHTSSVSDLIISDSNNDLFVDSSFAVYSLTDSQLTFRNSTYGEIKYLSGIIQTGNDLFGGSSSDIRFGNNSAFVNSTQTGLNVSANVTLYGLLTNYANPTILKDGIECNNCYNFTSLNAGTVIFNVTSFSNYSIGEDYTLNNCGNLTVVGATYTLIANITNHVGTCFTISANNITLNGNNNIIDGDDSGTDRGIYIASTYSGIRVLNFRNITDFFRGIYNLGNNQTLSNIISSSNLQDGLYTSGNNTVLINITSNNNVNGFFIDADYSFIYNVSANSNSEEGIELQGNQVILERYNSTYNSIGLLLSNNFNNTIKNLFSDRDSRPIYLFATTNNSIINSSINNSIEHAISFMSASSGNNILNNISIRNTNVSFRDLHFNNAGTNGTQIIDMPHIGNYSIAGTGGFISVKNTKYGEIKFLTPVNGSGTNFTKDISINNNSAFVNSTQTGLNKSANVTLYGIGERGFANPYILKDGSYCTNCYNFTSINATNVIFNVSSWSNYSIGNDTYGIYNCGTLSSAGTYVLRNNINEHNGNCFEITASNVTFEGNGYVVDGDDSGTDVGIYINGNDYRNVTVKNFRNITDFGYGIDMSYGPLLNNLTNISLSSNDYGLYLHNTNDHNITNLRSVGNNLDLYSSSSGNLFIDSIIGVYNLDVVTSIFRNSTYGEIRYLDFVSQTGSNLIGNLTSDIRFANNSAFVNSSSSPGLSQEANVTLYGIGERGYASPSVLRDGSYCTNCYNFTSLNATNVIFNVSSWSNYSIGNDTYGIYNCGTLSSAGYTYTLRNNIINYSGTCFTIGADNITLDLNNYIIDGTNDGDNAYWGVYASGRNNVTIKNGKITEFGDLFESSIFDGGAIKFIGTNNSIIQNINQSYNYLGIYLDNSKLNRFENINTSSNNHGFLLTQSQNNTFYNLVSGSNYVSVGLYAGSNNTNVSNVYSINSQFGVEVNDAHNNYIYNVTSNGAGTEVGVRLYSSKNNRVNRVNSYSLYDGVVINEGRNNTLSNVNSTYSAQTGVSLSSTRENVLENITALSNIGNGIYVTSSHNNSLRNLTIFNNSNGVNVEYSENNSLINIYTYNNSASGIAVSGSFAVQKLYNSIDNVISINNGYVGVLIESQNNTLSNINASNNAEAGLFLGNLYGANNTLYNLTLRNNLYGLVLSQKDNKIYNITSLSNSGYDFIQSSVGANGSLLSNANIGNYWRIVLGQLSFENSNYGKIDYLVAANGSGTNLIGNSSSDIIIGNNSVFMNSSKEGLNKSANITLYGIGERGYTNPVMLRDGSYCTNCYNFTSLNATNVMFNVTRGGNYSIGNFMDLIKPQISFVSPTPLNASTSGGHNIYVNVSSSDSEGSHYTLLDFDNSLKGFWSMEEPSNNISDYSPNNANGIAQVSGSINYSQPGIINNSITFRPAAATSANYIYNSTTSVVSGDASRSVSFWEKYDGTSGAATFFVFGYGTSCSANQYFAIVSTSTTGMDIYGCTGTYDESLTLSTNLRDGNWHHVVVTYDNSTKNITVYDNGAVTGSILRGASEAYNTRAGYKIGQFADHNRAFNGSMDEIAVFNRTLSLQEVKSLYNATLNQYYNNFSNLSYRNYTFRAYAVDGVGNKNQTELRIVNLTNTIPNVPTLLYPINYNVNYTRNLTFGWSGSDSDGDGLQYELNITCYNNVGTICSSKGNDNRYYNIGTIGSATSYELPTDLKYFSDDNYHYNWSVRAYDGYNYSAWSSSYHFNLSIVYGISLPINVVDFEVIQPFVSYDTSSNSPQPFIIQNDGNTLVNITVNASDLWQSVANPNEYYQFKVGNNSISSPNENRSFNWINSVTDYTNMSNITTLLLAIAELNYRDNNDSARFDIKIRSPPSEGVGRRNSTITFMTILGE